MYSTIQSVRTVAIFLDIPVFVEAVLTPMPLLTKGLKIEFDDLGINHIKTLRRFSVSGEYTVESVSLKYGPDHSGLTQYVKFMK